MIESVAAETYVHTLHARPYFFPFDDRDRDPRLSKISSQLLQLPLEIRNKIYEFAFSGNRVAVTANNGCYCASDTTGPYRADHKWLLTELSGPVRQDTQRAFIKLAMWELHCIAAFNVFLRRMRILNTLSCVTHVRINVFETSREHWELPLDELSSLRTITFAPWQKGWTIDIPEKEGSQELSDLSVMEKVCDVLSYKDGYKPVRSIITGQRNFKVFFVFPIRYLLPGEARLKRWQLRVWRADFDANTIDRDWREIHLLQEATLD